MQQWIRIAMRRDIVMRSLKVAAVVGTMLVAINQGDLLLAGQLNLAGAWKIALTYLVPYCVSTHASVAAACGD
jgi:hypothetical protein